jgi:hypothetical protein
VRRVPKCVGIYYLDLFTVSFWILDFQKCLILNVTLLWSDRKLVALLYFCWQFFLRFHQSFFFYLLSSGSRYVSIGMYMPMLGLLGTHHTHTSHTIFLIWKWSLFFLYGGTNSWLILVFGSAKLPLGLPDRSNLRNVMQQPDGLKPLLLFQKWNDVLSINTSRLHLSLWATSLTKFFRTDGFFARFSTWGEERSIVAAVVGGGGGGARRPVFRVNEP